MSYVIDEINTARRGFNIFASRRYSNYLTAQSEFEAIAPEPGRAYRLGCLERGSDEPIVLREIGG